MRRRTLWLLLCFISSLFPVSEVKAMDPVTIAVLAPVALKGARMASPYVIAGLKSAGGQLKTIGSDFVDILMLPLGVVQATAGAPFGFLSVGIGNIASGVCAPFKLVWDLLIFPISFFPSS